MNNGKDYSKAYFPAFIDKNYDRNQGNKRKLYFHIAAQKNKRHLKYISYSEVAEG